MASRMLQLFRTNEPSKQNSIDALDVFVIEKVLLLETTTYPSKQQQRNIQATITHVVEYSAESLGNWFNNCKKVLVIDNIG